MMRPVSAAFCTTCAFAFIFIQYPNAALAQVTYFSTVPTAEQLQQALRSGPATRSIGSASEIGRGIRYNDASTRESDILWQQNRSEAVTSGGESGTSGGGSGESGMTVAVAPAVAVPINFKVDSSQVTKLSLAYIEAIADVMERDSSIKLLVEGHSDTSGDQRRNLFLSWERAFTVYKLLVTRYGIDPARLRPMGIGSSEPIPGAVPATNRRVQFRLMG